MDIYKNTIDPRSWIEIDKNKAKENIKQFRKIINQNCLLGGVVKSNAYGHDLVKFSKLLADQGVDWLMVDNIHEALILREEDINAPILVLGYTPPSFFKDAYEKNIKLTISSEEAVSKLIKAKDKPKIHIKINTGMNRQGIFPNELDNLLDRLIKNNIIIDGVYTHFANADLPESKETKKQIKKFEECFSVIKKNNINPIKHANATAGTINFPKAKYDMVRIGIGLYGLWPSKELKEKFSNKIKLQQVLSWKSKISEVKNLPTNSSLGYNFTKTLDKEGKIALCPVGYWHGYSTRLSNRSFVYINNKKAPVVGRVSMDIMILDVTDIEVSIGDEVTIIDNRLSIDYYTEKLGIINYEFVTRINPLIERKYID